MGKILISLRDIKMKLSICFDITLSPEIEPTHGLFD